MKNSILNINFLKNILFPPKCIICNKINNREVICENCWNEIPWIERECNICGIPIEENDKICTDCAVKTHFFDKAVSVFVYNELSSKIMLMFKNADETSLASALVQWMYDKATTDIEQADVIVPVPIHFSKRLKRLYNQSELLAQKISEISGIKYEPRVLEKIKKTHTQEGLSAKKRNKNVIGSFGVSEKYKNTIKNKKVLLIDDVMTTGATVDECSRILKNNGAEKVVVLTAARAILNKNT